MTGYDLERTIVGWEMHYEDNPYQDRRFEIVYEDGRTLHYPWGVDAAQQLRNTPSAWPFVCHEPDYRPIAADPEQRFACEHCGQVVRPVFGLEKS